MSVLGKLSDPSVAMPKLGGPILNKNDLQNTLVGCILKEFATDPYISLMKCS